MAKYSTLGPCDYDSFATAILNQNHLEIDITELILMSIKVIIEGFSNNVIDNMAASLKANEILSFFSSEEVSFPPDSIWQFLRHLSTKPW